MGMTIGLSDFSDFSDVLDVLFQGDGMGLPLRVVCEFLQIRL